MKKLVAACSLAFLLIVPVAVGADRVLSRDPEPGISLANAIAFRSEFGFDSDVATVTALLKAADSNYTYAAPLTAAEFENMQERERLIAQAEPLTTFVSNHPDEFGGMYFTQDRGRVEATLMETRAISEADATKARSLTPQGMPMTVRMVDFATSDLEKASQALIANRDSLGLKTVWPNTKANRLSAILSPGSSALAAQQVSDAPVDVTFGEGLSPVSCTSRSACTPYRGGIRIVDVPPHEACTWGFYGTRGLAAKYIITAGHCGRRGYALSHNGVTFSDPADRNVFDEVTSSNSDSMTAHVLGSPNAVSPFNTIYVSSTDKSHAITATKSNDSQTVGTPVCFFGRRLGFFVRCDRSDRDQRQPR